MFREIVLVDFEFTALPGERPKPVCVVAKLLREGRTIRLMADQLGDTPPYSTDASTLFVAFYASAELGCHRALGWPKPARILDLYAEFRNRTNGLTVPAGRSLLGALIYFGLDITGATEKSEMQQAIGNGTWRERYTEEEVLEYCGSDVAALERLLPVMFPNIDLPRALLRGRYMVAAAAIEWNGTPVDVVMHERFSTHWTGIQDHLIAAIDAFGIYDGRTFKSDRWANFLVRHGIPVPLLESGRLDLSDDTFRQMAKTYPLVSPYRELRHALSDMRLNDLAVGRDGRNRTLLSAFQSRTGRNQPSNTKGIFGTSVWLRGLIKPPPGYGIAYVDWAQQEFGIAAALSSDAAMQAAYRSGDPYLTFAKQAGIVPADATRTTHPFERELAKACVLAVLYGMGAEALALRIGQPLIVARALLRAHRETYPQFWRWSDAAVDLAMLRGSLHTVFGWHVHIDENPNPRSLRNFPMQANGAEMMRVAACLATECGIEVCAPIHDAFLICAPLDHLDADVARMREAMAEASRVVLDGFELGTDARIIIYPDRYMDPRGEVMWDRVTRLVNERQPLDRAV
jgi:DNA polymerase I